MVLRSIATGKEVVVADSQVVDADVAIVDRARRVIQAVAFSPGRRQWTVVDAGVREDFESLARVDDGDLNWVGRDLADRKWIVSFASDLRPAHYYAWDRSDRKRSFYSARNRGSTMRRSRR